MRATYNKSDDRNSKLARLLAIYQATKQDPEGINKLVQSQEADAWAQEQGFPNMQTLIVDSNTKLHEEAGKERQNNALTSLLSAGAAAGIPPNELRQVFNTAALQQGVESTGQPASGLDAKLSSANGLPEGPTKTGAPVGTKLSNNSSPSHPRYHDKAGNYFSSLVNNPVEQAVADEIHPPSRHLGIGGEEITPDNPRGQPGGDPFTNGFFQSAGDRQAEMVNKTGAYAPSNPADILATREAQQVAGVQRGLAAGSRPVGYELPPPTNTPSAPDALSAYERKSGVAPGTIPLGASVNPYGVTGWSPSNASAVQGQQQTNQAAGLDSAGPVTPAVPQQTAPPPPPAAAGGAPLPTGGAPMGQSIHGIIDMLHQHLERLRPWGAPG